MSHICAFMPVNNVETVVG